MTEPTPSCSFHFTYPFGNTPDYRLTKTGKSYREIELLTNQINGKGWSCSWEITMGVAWQSWTTATLMS